MSVKVRNLFDQSELDRPLYHTSLNYQLPSIKINFSASSNRDRQILENLSLSNVPAKRECVLLRNTITKSFAEQSDKQDDPITKILNKHSKAMKPLQIGSITISLTDFQSNQLKRSRNANGEEELEMNPNLPTMATPLVNKTVFKQSFSNKKLLNPQLSTVLTPPFLKKPKLLHPLKKFKRDYGPNDSQTIKPDDVLKMVDSSLVSSDYDDSILNFSENNGNTPSLKWKKSTNFHLEISAEDLNFAKNDNDYVGSNLNPNN